MDLATLKRQMTVHEGREKNLYKCSANKWSIGIGHNIEDNGLSAAVLAQMFKEGVEFSDAVIDLMFKEDLQESIDDLESRLFPALFEQLPANVQHVLIDMRFQLGFKRFRKFKNMIAAVIDRDWPGMIREMKDSVWYRQIPNRPDNLIAMVMEVM